LSSSEDLAKQIEEMKALVASLNENIAPAKEKAAECTAEEQAAYAEYQQKVVAIRARKEQFNNLVFEAQSKANKIQRELEVAARNLEAAKKQEEKEARAAERAKELAELSAKWETLTMGAPWREWAKNHQVEGGETLVRNRATIVADPMGLGKTLTSIIMCDMAEAATREASEEFPFLGEEKDVYIPQHYENMETGEKIPSWNYDPENPMHVKIDAHYEPKIVNGITRPVGKRILYFCPASLLKNVEREFRNWSPHRSVLIIGGFSKAERRFAIDMLLKNSPEFVVICNYEAWRRDKALLEDFIELDFDTVIIDEAHNIKDPKTSAYKGIEKVLQEAKPEYVIPMTGTPLLNKPDDLYTLLHLVNPIMFSNLNDFHYEFCQQDWETQKWYFKPGGLQLLTAKISKHFMRRTRDQAGIELPEKTITFHNLKVDVQAWPEQAKVREQMRKNAIIKLSENKGIAAAAMIAVFTRLRQIETWPAGIVQEIVEKQDGKRVVVETIRVDVEESQKMDYILRWNKDDQEWEGLATQAFADERGVVFSQFTAPLHELKDRLKRMGKRVAVLDGHTPKPLREEILMDFDNKYVKEDFQWDVVLCNYKVGGVGANLTCATQMIILDEEWNPGKRDQAYDRIHRIGQDKPVTIHVIRNENTIDDWSAGIMEEKEGMVEGFNNATAMISADDALTFLNDSGLM
jgi:SNF2 family DNA or RNA helicase